MLLVRGSQQALKGMSDSDLLVYLVGSHHGYGRPLWKVELKDDLPPSTSIEMGPIATALGEVYMWSVEARPGAKNEQGQPYSAIDLRTIQEWIIKPQLRNVPGVIEINSIGGYEKQYDVTPRPEALMHGILTLHEKVKKEKIKDWA